MPYKDPLIRKQKHKEYSAKHYQANKVKVAATTKETKRAGKAKWVLYKSKLRCTKCGFNHAAALDFHHVDPATKLDNVRNLIGYGQFAAAYEEIKKCVVLCSNCHRIHHHEDRLAKKIAKKKKKLA